MSGRTGLDRNAFEKDISWCWFCKKVQIDRVWTKETLNWKRNYSIPSSSGVSGSHIFWIVSSTFQTRSVWSRDHVINSMSEFSYWRFGRQAKSSITSLCPWNEQIGELWRALFHKSRLFSPRPKLGTITVTNPSANGYHISINTYKEQTDESSCYYLVWNKLLIYRISSSPHRRWRGNNFLGSSRIVDTEIFHSSILACRC